MPRTQYFSTRSYAKAKFSTSAQCPMPNAQCPMPNAQFPMPTITNFN
ncbi:MAG: hypothetical protein V7L26_20645 [Nostoc sp.]